MTEIRLTATEIGEYLANCNGFDTHYKHPLMPRISYSQGVKFLAENLGQCGAYWLIDKIVSLQLLPKIKNDSMLQDMQFWKLKTNLQTKMAVLTCDRDTDDVAYTEEIERTDVQVEEVRIWVQNNILFLPEEY